MESDPVVYLQSLEDPGLGFITAPVPTVDPRYRLKVRVEDLEQLGLPLARQPRLGEEALALTVVSIRETGPTANLLAPVLVNLRNRKALQAVSEEPGYSHQHAILPRDRLQTLQVAAAYARERAIKPRDSVPASF